MGVVTLEVMFTASHYEILKFNLITFGDRKSIFFLFQNSYKPIAIVVQNDEK